MQKRYWFLILLAFLVLLWIGGKYFVGQKVDALIEAANQDGRVLKPANLSTSFSLLAVGIDAAEVELDQNIGTQKIKGQVANINIDGLSVFSLLFNKTPQISSLLLDRPDLIISPLADSLTVTTDTNKLAADPLLCFHEVQIKNGRIRRIKRNDQLVVEALGIDISVEECLIPLQTAQLTAVNVDIDTITAPNNAIQADWKITGFQHLAGTDIFRLNRVTLAPRQSAEQYLTNLTYKDEWMALRMDSLSISNFPLDAILAKEHARVEQIDVGDLNVAIYENPTLPRDPNERKKEMPIQDFRRLGVPATLQRMNIKRTNIEYGVVGDAGRSSNLNLKNGSIEVRNFSTVLQQDSAHISTRFDFNGSAPLEAYFSLDQSEEARNFRMWGSMEAYSLPDLNPLMVIAADVTIESGQLNRIDYSATVKDEVSRGELLFKYQDLEIKMEGKNAWLKNLAKGFAVLDHNPKKNGDMRRGQIYHEHPGDRSFFNLYWKSIVSGMQSTVVGSLFNPEELDAEKVSKKRQKE